MTFEADVLCCDTNICILLWDRITNLKNQLFSSSNDHSPSIVKHLSKTSIVLRLFHYVWIWTSRVVRCQKLRWIKIVDTQKVWDLLTNLRLFLGDTILLLSHRAPLVRLHWTGLKRIYRVSFWLVPPKKCQLVTKFWHLELFDGIYYAIWTFWAGPVKKLTLYKRKFQKMWRRKGLSIKNL